MNRSGVSIVIPTRDRPHLLELTLRSVLAQRLVEIDVIVVDDGAGPETRTLIETLGDPAVRLFSTGGACGVSVARNLGIEHARHDLVAFCDDDDLWAPDKLAQQLLVLNMEAASWAYAGDVTVDADLRVLSGQEPLPPEAVLSTLPRYNAVPAGASNVVIRAEALAAAGGFDPALRTSEDWDLWLRLAGTAGRPACVPHPLVALRKHGDMASRDTRQVLQDIETVARRHAIPVDRARHDRWAAWMALEEGSRWTAVRHYAGAVAEGDWRSAGRAVVAVLDPRITRQRVASPESRWMAEAQQWLDLLRASTGSEHP